MCSRLCVIILRVVRCVDVCIYSTSFVVVVDVDFCCCLCCCCLRGWGTGRAGWAASLEGGADISGLVMLMMIMYNAVGS